MSDDLDGFDSEHETNDGVHSNLISAVTQLEGKHRVKASVRKEPSVEVSEFHLVKSGTGKLDAVHLGDLAASLKNQASHSIISQKIKESIEKGSVKTLNKPLEKVEATRIDRTVRYADVKKDIGRWEAVVQSNRVSETLSFPLNHETVKIKNAADLVKNFKPETDLEIAMEEALNEGGVIEEVAMKEESQFPMTLQELVQRRQELAKLRAQQSYRELKELRHSKIKSKKFHRILRKEKMKQQLKDFEILKESNPELALRQLEELDRNRAEERASLRHRNTGKWAKGKAIRAKYDTESRKVLAQQLAISKELTQKVRKDDSSDEDHPASTQLPVAEDNPWVGPTGPAMANDVVQFYNSYQEYKKTQKDKRDVKMEAKIAAAMLPTSSVDGGKAQLFVKQQFANLESEVFNDNHSPPINKEDEAKEISIDNLEARNKTSKEKASKQVDRPIEEVLVDSAGDGLFVEAGGNKRKRGVGAAGGCASKKKRVEAVTVAAASGNWSVVSQNSTKGGAKPKLLPSIDALFDNIDDTFKKQLSSRMSDLKAELQIDGGNLVPARTNEVYDVDEGDLLALKRPLRAQTDEPLSEGLSREPSRELPGGKSNLPPLVSDPPVACASVDIDPAKFLQVTPKHLHTRLPDEIGAGDHALDDIDDEERQAAITEAFADDDVVADFAKELRQAAKGDAVKPEPKTMPGWGSWVSDLTNVQKLRRLKNLRKRGVKAKKLPMRVAKANVFGVPIVSNVPCTELKEHMVRDLPFPFTSVAAYEASIRAPLGRTWVTEVAHRRLTAPKLTTRLGTIIKPMDESSLVKMGRSSLPLPRRNPVGGKPRKDNKSSAKRQRV